MGRELGRLAAGAFAALALASGALGAELEVEWAPMRIALDAYQVERRVDQAGVEFAPLVRVSSASTRFLDTHVEAGVRYCYRVRGVRGVSVSPPSPPLCGVAAESLPAPELVAVQQIPAPRPAEPQAEATASTESVDGAPQASSSAATVPEESDPSAEGDSAESSSSAPDPASAPIAVDRDVRALRRPAPVFPTAAILQGLSGWVRLRFTVTASGTTRDIEVVASEPPGVFEQAAVDAAKRFVYSPRTYRGVPIDRPGVETEVTFTLIEGEGGELVTSRREPGPPR